MPDDVLTLTNELPGPHPDTEAAFPGRGSPPFPPFASLPPLLGAQVGGRESTQGPVHAVRAPRAGPCCLFPLLPLILGFLIKITWAVSARNASMFSLFSVDGNHMWNLCLPFSLQNADGGADPGGGLCAQR